MLADKEHLDIHLNKHVANLMEVIEASDKLVLLYVMHSGITHDKNGQNWGTLDLMFLKVLEDLKAGYVTTFVIDCAAEHPEIDPKVQLDYICN